MIYPDNIPDNITLISNTVVRKHVCISKYDFDRLEFMQALVQHLMDHPDPMIVPVYRFEYLGKDKYGWHKYSYDMMRLGILTEFEQKLVNLVGDADSFGNPRPYEFNTELSADQANLMIEGWEKNPKLMMYLRDIILLNRYHDLHAGNIMKDDKNNYRIIDLEGFMHGSFKNKNNEWITTLRSTSHQLTAPAWIQPANV